jgi:hypothetical protein
VIYFSVFNWVKLTAKWSDTILTFKSGSSDFLRKLKNWVIYSWSFVAILVSLSVIQGEKFISQPFRYQNENNIGSRSFISKVCYVASAPFVRPQSGHQLYHLQ